jgi:hypothetical protein
MDANGHHRRGSGLSRGAWALIGFVAVAAYFLFAEHRAHAIEYLPFGLLLACLVMHFVHGHGSHGTHGDRSGQPAGGQQRGGNGERR